MVRVLMLVARAQGGAEPLTSVRRTGRGWRSQCRSQGHGSPGWAIWGERGMQGHEQGEPGRETSPAGPSEGPVEGHAPGVGAAFSLGLWSQGLVHGWRMFSPLHCQEWSSSE